MSTFVLVHGAWHGNWCWDKVVPLLEEAGHKVVTPDLPGRADDDTPHSKITLQDYADSICRVLNEQDEPVILVGHSAGGIAISQAAEQCPEKIGVLVYLCAFLLRDGESRIGSSRVGDEAPVPPPYLVVSEDRSSALLRKEGVGDLFYNDCSEEDVEWARSRLVSEPLALPATPVRLTEEKFGRVPRVYIECLRDQGITPSEQKRMYSASPCQRVISMDTSHSPFFSAPEELAGHLISIAEHEG